MSEGVARGSFEITMTPREGVLDGTGRFDFVKTWSGDLTADGAGAMFSAGDPAAGAAVTSPSRRCAELLLVARAASLCCSVV